MEVLEREDHGIDREVLPQMERLRNQHQQCFPRLERGERFLRRDSCLAACSSFFKKVLRKVQHSHPLIYMKGVKYSDLEAVLSFVYHGEVSMAEADLNSFLAVAEELEVTGLTCGKNSSEGNSNNPQQSNVNHRFESSSNHKFQFISNHQYLQSAQRSLLFLKILICF